MNTRSKCSNHDSWLSVTVYGGGGIVPSSRMTTRFGPSAPRCSQIEEEPGPPLKTKQTGRDARNEFRHGMILEGLAVEHDAALALAWIPREELVDFLPHALLRFFGRRG